MVKLLGAAIFTTGSVVPENTLQRQNCPSCLIARSYFVYHAQLLLCLENKLSRDATTAAILVELTKNRMVENCSNSNTLPAEIAPTHTTVLITVPKSPKGSFRWISFH